MHVVIAGGGTAGHIEPALALADALRRRDPDVGVTALGTARGLDTTLIPARGYELALIPPVPFPRRPSADALRVPGRLRNAVRTARDVLRDKDADVLVGFGGYVAGPAYLAARSAKVPIVVHEANPRPGWANRLGARFTPYVAVSFPGTALAHARFVGLPIRRSIALLDRPARRAEA
ncbi:MAG: UDP-N-acetylglucosamine--N-acetylmuramyl-(pentapeptide) pyrophosphoryl-undecaprenol N-acetylglucosamine transferase, partial [Actinomycetes bacterium]